MGFLESIWEAIVSIADKIGTILSFTFSSFENIGLFFAKIPLFSDAIEFSSFLFPNLFISALTSLLSTFIAIRVLRFLTFQG